jgi:hypothetical protein
MRQPFAYDRAADPVRRWWSLVMQLEKILIKSGVVTAEQIATAVAYQKINGGSLILILARLGVASEIAIAQAVAGWFGVPAVDLAAIEIEPAVIELVPFQTAIQHKVLPLQRVGSALTLALSDPTELLTLDDIRLITGLQVNPVVAPESQLAAAIAKYYAAEEAGLSASLRVEEAGDEADDGPAPASARHVKEVAGPNAASDPVHFSVTAPQRLAPGKCYVLDVWVHLASQRDEVLSRARFEYGSDKLRMKSKSGERISRGTRLTIQLSLPSIMPTEAEDACVWEGEIANVTFPLAVPDSAASGQQPGTASVYAAGLLLAKIHFVVEIGAEIAAAGPAAQRQEEVRSAFASYATEDRADVLARIQGIQKARPDLDIFLDVVSLRSGQVWFDRIREEIQRRDVFYLFWSKAASESEWVEREWRMALERRGVGFISPVPLVDPELAPPPAELGRYLHFNDWVLAFTRGRT